MSHRRPKRAAGRSVAATLPAVRPLTLAIHLTLLGGAFAAAGWSPSAMAQSTATAQATRSYDIPAGPLSSVLTRFSRETGVFLVGAGSAAEGKTSPGLRGSYSVQAGFAALLTGTGLVAVQQSDGSYGLEPAPAAAPAVASDRVATLPVVKVTGQRVRPGGLPEAYAGGQVARGGQVGMLGNKDVMDTPFSQTNYTNKTIADQQARSLNDVLANEPSIITGVKNGGANEFMEYRGFMSQTLSAGNSLNGLSGMAPLQFASTDYIERVEVLRGPSALLKGASLAGQAALGGTVNLVSKRADDDPLTRGQLRYLSDSQVGVHVDLGRRFGDNKEFGARFNGSIDGGDTPVETQHSKFRTAAVNLDYRGERVRLAIDVAHQSSELTAPSSALGLGNVLTGLKAIPKAPDNDIALLPSWAWVNHKITLGMVQGEVDVTDSVTAYAAVGAQRYESDSNTPRVDLANSAGAFTIRATDYHERYDTRSMQGGLRATAVTGPVSHALNLNLSRVEWKYGLTPNTCRACSGAGPLVPAGTLYDPVFPTSELTTDPGAFEYQSRVVTSSIAIADTLSALDDRVQLTAGVRRQRVKSEGLGSRSLTATADTSAWSPSLALVVKPWERVSLYGSYIENLQPGSVAASIYANAGQAFPPYKSKQYETGAKIDWGKVVTTLALFQIAQPSAIPVASTSGGLPTLRLDGEQRNRGIELNAFGEPTQGVRLLGGFTYVDAIQTKTRNGTYDGMRAAGAPKYRFVIGGEVDTPFIEGLTLSGRLTHTSDSVVANSRPDLTVPSWTQVDLGARYSFVGPWKDKPITLRLNVDNVFDKSYWKVMHVVGQVWRSDPRTVRLSATMDF
ncbi:MAG: TonB-dependent receptor [Rubrivivax sp.]